MDTGIIAFMFCVLVIVVWFQYCTHHETKRELNHIKSSLVQVFDKLTLAVRQQETGLAMSVIEIRNDVFDILFVPDQHKEKKELNYGRQ